MKTNRFCLSALEEINFSITYIDGTSVNHGIHQNEPHIHQECEIYVNLSGNVSFQVEGYIYPVSRGSIIITRPYEYHHCIYHTDDPHEHFWITFSAPQNKEYLKSFFAREKGYNNLIALQEESLNEVCGLLFSLLQNTNPLEQRIGVLKLFNNLEKSKHIAHFGNTENLPAAVVNGLIYMDDHLTEDIDVKTIAAFCNVSVNTLERHFKQALNCHPMKMLREKRLFASIQYLQRGETVANTAAKCGFSDYSNYIQLFKKLSGMTPLQYKKKYTSEQSLSGIIHSD